MVGLIAAAAWRHRLGATDLALGQQALSQRRWDDATHDAESAKGALPFVFQDEAARIDAAAAREKGAAAHLASARAAIDAQNWNAATTDLDAIPPDSVYSSDASILRARITAGKRDQAAAASLATARADANAGQWAAARDALATIPPDSSSAGDAATLRAQVDQGERDQATATQALDEARTAMRLQQWDAALQALTKVAPSRPKEQEEARALSDQILASRTTAKIVAAASKVAAVDNKIATALTDLRIGFGSAQDYLTVRDNVQDLSLATDQLVIELNSESGVVVMPVRLLRDSGNGPATTLDRAASTARALVVSNTPFTAGDADSLDTALDGFRAWSQSMFLTPPVYPNPLPPALGEGQTVADLIPYAANPDPATQRLLGWLVATNAESPAEGEAVLRYFPDDFIASSARTALADRLENPTALILYTSAPIQTWSEPSDASAGAGDIAPGTVMDDLGEALGINDQGSEFVSYRRVRLRSTGMVAYIPWAYGGTTTVVRSSNDDLIRSLGPNVLAQVQSYLVANNRLLFDVLVGKMTGDGQTRLLLSGSERGCADCGSRWIAVWDTSTGKPLWELPSTDATVFGLLAEGNGFEITSPVALPGEPFCCPSRERVRSMIWNGSTFVPGAARDMDLPHPPKP